MLHIFRGGKTIDGHGQRITFDEASIAKIARDYNAVIAANPGLDAPIVIGHPIDNAPAYGWIKRLVAKGLDLFAEAQQMDSAFQELVQLGRYKKISSSFYLPGSPANPIEGYMLRHVGFLGAMPPAIKGLKSTVFREEADPFLTLDFVEDSSMDDLKAALEAIFASLMTAMPDAIPQEQVDALMIAIDIMAEEEDAVTLAETVETAKDPAYTEQQTALDRREAAIAVKEKAIATQEGKVIRTTITAFCEDMCKVGKMSAGEKPKALKLLSLAATAPSEYSEAGESALEMSMSSYRDRKPLLTFGEISRDVPGQSLLVPEMGDANSVTVAAAARQRMQTDATLSYAEAVREVLEVQ